MTAKLFAGLKVGDRILKVTESGRNREPKREPVVEWVTVTKVGRQYGEAHKEGARVDKWTATRFDLTTGHSGEFASHLMVRLFHDEAEWRARGAAEKAWRRLVMSIQHKWECPPTLTEADILTAAELLKLDIEP